MAKRLYAGFALTVQQLYVGDKPANVQADVRCVDYTWQFGFLTVTRQYRTQSASAIAADLVARYAARQRVHEQRRRARICRSSTRSRSPTKNSTRR